MQINQQKGIKPRMREHKLRTGVYWKGALKKRHKTNWHETRPWFI